VITKRTLVNLAVFLGISALLVFAGATQLVLQKGGGRTLGLEFADAGGLAPRDDVTMRGVPVGTVSEVTLTARGMVDVGVHLEPGTTVPSGTRAAITRRSPIGDITVELTPGSGAPLADGGLIPLAHTTSLPDAERTIEILAQVLHAVPSQDLSRLVSELATGLRGRGEDLATLAEAGADLPERLLQVKAQLESLIRNGPKVTGVFAAHADALAADITDTAVLTDILRDRRFDLVNLMKNGARFSQLAGSLLHDEKPNLACLVRDFGDVNATLAEPANLGNLRGALDFNHFFFDAVWQAVQEAKDGVMTWFRVQVLPHTEPPGRSYAPHRPPPDVYPGQACETRYGRGVGPVNQRVYWLATGSRIVR
jgi:phospholipid/cholesterol/gamma-HCH transport system substrate-binding protein